MISRSQIFFTSIIIWYCLLPIVNSIKWDYYPNLQGISRPKYGIVMGGSRDMFQRSGRKLPSWYYTTCIARIYAEKHNYAFYVDKNLDKWANLTSDICPQGTGTAWNKIKLIQQYVLHVDILMWIDLDGLIMFPNSNLDKILLNHTREYYKLAPYVGDGKTELGVNIKDFDVSDLPGNGLRPILWFAKDVNPNYAVNVNSAVFAVRNSPLGIEFLEKVWEVSKDSHAFEKHDPYWKDKVPCHGYYGWPWEQGGIWDVLSDTKDTRFLQHTSILPNSGKYGLNTVMDTYDQYDGKGLTFVLHHHNKIEDRFRHMLSNGVFTSYDVMTCSNAN